MGKKLKLGKQRKDKFYHLAKDAGYRSRAAFKLIQLNRKFEFLQRAKVLVDLCAAPGGWLQVAQQNMPVSSLIIGVDLVPIKAIPNTITLQEDITTPKCRQSLKRNLTTWKVDVVLHDGAPNVGKSWDHDAFQQAQLTLHAFKLATEVLVKGGWFITKVFRSKDYNALLWVFKKLFKKVHATKPQASRNESAEIFVVCQHFIAPDKIDPKFLDAAHVFQDVEPESKLKLNLFKPDSKQKVKAEGYPEGKSSTENKVTAMEFVNGNNHLELLANCTEIVFEDEIIARHPLTNLEIRECCKDIKVLGKSELKSLLAWKKKIKLYLGKLNKLKPAKEIQDGMEVDGDEEPSGEKVTEVIVEEEDIEAERSRYEKTLIQEEKRKKKKVLKDKRKLQAKTELKMVIKNDEPIAQEDIELFQLAKLRRKHDVTFLQDQDPNILSTNDINEPEEDEGICIGKMKATTYERNGKNDEDWNPFNSEEQKSESDESSSELERFSENDEDDLDFEEYDEVKEEDKNMLVVSLDDRSKSRQAEMWFDKELFANGEIESDEELELNHLNDFHKKQNETKAIIKTENEYHSSDDEAEKEPEKEVVESDDDSSSEDELPIPKRKRKRIRLDPEGLALGTMMIKSQKTKRDITDAAYNRYTYNDDNVPEWFRQDEEKHNRPTIPVSAEMVQDYKARLKEINARPIKKVAEAKARKKKREVRKLDRARKKAEAVTENVDMSAHEKVQHIKSIYKNALADKKDKNVTYVFPKKGIGKKVRRPQGVKGKFKVVDKRMKKDNRKQKQAEKPKKSTRRKKRRG